MGIYMGVSPVLYSLYITNSISVPEDLKNVVSSKVIRNKVLYIVFLHDLMGVLVLRSLFSLSLSLTV